MDSFFKMVDVQTVLFIYMAVDISTTVLVPENVRYILADKHNLTVYSCCSYRAKLCTVKYL